MSGVAVAHLESVLETEIAEHLAANGWLYSPHRRGYDRASRCSRRTCWAGSRTPCRPSTRRSSGRLDSQLRQEAAKALLLKRLVKALDNDPFKNGGTLQLLRGGFSFVPLTGGTVKVRRRSSGPPRRSTRTRSRTTRRCGCA